MSAIIRVVMFLLLLLSSSVQAQERAIPSQPAQPQPGKDRPPLPDYLKEAPAGDMELPPAPEATRSRAGGPAFTLNGVVFEGNTVFPDADLTEIAAPFIGKPVTLGDLEEIRYRLTRFYVDRGYVNSGAILKPDQQVDDGVVTYQIQEGRLDDVTVSGNGRLRPAYITKRLWADPEKPFNTEELQKRFQLLLRDPLIERMNGRIRPGVAPGEATLDLEVTRSRPYDLRFVADNHRPPSTGAEHLTAAGAVWNLTGFGDVLDASFGVSEGADEISAGYALPLNANNTRLSLRYSRGENAVIEEPLDVVDIESETESAQISLTHPLRRTLGETLEVGVDLSVRESKTFLLSRPFSFTTGAVKGDSQVTALRLVGSYVNRTPATALALRSTVSVGVDLFGPTIHGHNLPDGRFLTWLGQIQYARRLGGPFGQVIFRGDVQVSGDRLLSLEQFAVGGASTVRGYRENELVRDSGYALSAEWRYPLWERREGAGPENILQIAPFMDFGSAWNKGESAHDDNLHSVGVGLLWNPTSWIDAELYLAHDLEKAADKDEHNLQDDGIHFRITVEAL